MNNSHIRSSGAQNSISDKYFLELGLEFREPKTMEIGWTPRAGASRD